MRATYEDAEDASRSRGKTVASAAIFGGEELRGDGVQDTIHYLQGTNIG